MKISKTELATKAKDLIEKLSPEQCAAVGKFQKDLGKELLDFAKKAIIKKHGENFDPIQVDNAIITFRAGRETRDYEDEKIEEYESQIKKLTAMIKARKTFLEASEAPYASKYSDPTIAVKIN